MFKTSGTRTSAEHTIPEDLKLQNHCCENLKSRKLILTVILGFHGGDYKDYCVVACDGVLAGRRVVHVYRAK